MERIAIIDHANHLLYIEDIDDDDLALYGGEEEKYIKDNYHFDGDWSWEYITSINYIPSEDPQPIEIEPSELVH